MQKHGKNSWKPDSTDKNMSRRCGSSKLTPTPLSGEITSHRHYARSFSVFMGFEVWAFLIGFFLVFSAFSGQVLGCFFLFRSVDPPAQRRGWSG